MAIHKINLLFLIFLIFLLPFSSAYTLIHYDDFKYDATPAQLIASHGFRADAGVYNCLSTTGAEHYLACASTGSTTYQRFNLINSSQFLTANRSYDGGAVNYSLRYRIKGSTSACAAGQYARVSTAEGNVSNSNLALTRMNNSDKYEITGYANANTALLTRRSSCYSDWTIIQIDYLNTPVPVGAMASTAANFSMLTNDGLYNSSYVVSSAAGTLHGTNTTRFYVRDLFMLDYIIVIAYAAGEQPINITQPIYDYYSMALNVMPVFDYTLKNRDGIFTNSVKSTTSCENITLPSGVSMLSLSCNPLYITPFNVVDAEADSMLKGIHCGSLSETQLYNENFNDSEYASQYNLHCNFTNFMYLYPEQALMFTDTMNESCLFITQFSKDSGDYNLLSSMSDYALTIDFGLGNNNNAYLDFFNYNSNRKISLGFAYNATLSKIQFIKDDVLQYVLNDFDNNTPLELNIVLDDALSSYSFRLAQYDAGTGLYDYFYSESFVFDWSVPLRYLYFYSLNASGMQENNNEYIGHITADGITLPPLTAYAANQSLNCSFSMVGTRTAYLFFSDAVHGNNYNNFQSFEWVVANININANMSMLMSDDAAKEGFDAIFMGSDTLKYLFVIVIIIITLSVGLYAGVLMGNAMLGAIASGIAICAILFICSMIGLVPVWIVISIFVITALILAGVVTKMLAGSGSGE